MNESVKTLEVDLSLMRVVYFEDYATKVIHTTGEANPKTKKLDGATIKFPFMIDLLDTSRSNKTSTLLVLDLVDPQLNLAVTMMLNDGDADNEMIDNLIISELDAMLRRDFYVETSWKFPKFDATHYVLFRPAIDPSKLN
jgi:hypothetical protein